MKRARFTGEQIVRILQEVDQSPIIEVAERHGVSEPSIYAWRKKFGDLGTDDVKRLRPGAFPMKSMKSGCWNLCMIS
jgi:putative transposase